MSQTPIFSEEKYTVFLMNNIMVVAIRIATAVLLDNVSVIQFTEIGFPNVMMF